MSERIELEDRAIEVDQHFEDRDWLGRTVGIWLSASKHGDQETFLWLQAPLAAALRDALDKALANEAKERRERW